MRLPSLVTLVAVSACAAPNAVEVALAPAVISSLDGKTTVSAIAANDSTPLSDVAVHMTVDYTDRNGTAHMIAPVDSRTDSRGVFTSTIDGLTWDGTGKVTVSSSDAVFGEATFAVLDRTPPKAEILPPTTDLRVGPGLPLDLQVHVSDEIGVSQVVIDTSGGLGGGRSTVLVSGTQDTKVTFRMTVPFGATPGPSLQVFALVTDLSGNSAAATPITLTVDPAITIATPPGLTGGLLVDGTAQQLVNPRDLVSDATLGILVVDGNRKEVTRVATCAPTTAGITFSMAANFDGPRGIALGPSGEIYVSDLNRDQVLRIDRSTGAVSGFENNVNGPYGMEWLAGGTSVFADSLMVASSDRIVASTKGNGALAAAYLRNAPIDLTFIAGTMMILTTPSGGNRGRIYRVSGF